jgi:hypothetical protein
MKLKKRGTVYSPAEEYNIVLVNVVIDVPMYSHKNKKYFSIQLQDVKEIEDAHEVVEPYLDRKNKRVINPLSNNNQFLKVKIPYNHGRVQCRMSELKTIHDYKKGDIVPEMTINFCGCWTIGEYSGISWKIISMN